MTTSRESLNAAYVSGLISAAQGRVLEFMVTWGGPVTQAQVARHYGDVTRSLGPRFRELIELDIIQEDGTTQDTQTNRRVKRYRLTGRVPGGPEDDGGDRDTQRAYRAPSGPSVREGAGGESWAGSSPHRVKRWPLDEARAMAGHVIERLGMYCDCIQIAGSVRRERPWVGDLEIVCIPSKVQAGLFEDEAETDHRFVAAVMRLPAVKGCPTGKYTQRRLPTGMKLDLFMATPENWGLILAIRTGSAEFSHKCLASRWAAMGYKSVGGILHRDGEVKELREEKDVFDLIGLKWIEPKDREYGA